MVQGTAKQGSPELQNPGMASQPGTGTDMEKDPLQTPFSCPHSQLFCFLSYFYLFLNWGLLTVRLMHF